MDARLAELCRAAIASVQQQTRLIERRPPGLPPAALAGPLVIGLAEVSRKVTALADERERRRGPLYQQLAPIAEAQTIVRELKQVVGEPDEARLAYDRLERKLDAVQLIVER